MGAEDEQGGDEEPTGLRADLRRIWKELDSLGFFLLIAAISTCGACANLDSIEGELDATNEVLKQTNVEIRELRETIERLDEQRHAR